VGAFSSALVREAAQRIARLPERLDAVLAGSSARDLERRYRPEGWTAAQVAHHLADSHVNAYARFKLALTEENPVIKPYFEDRWIGLPDASGAPVEMSLAFLRALHAKWAYLLGALTSEQWSRAYFHPEAQKLVPLYDTARHYAWHGEHHLRHIEIALHSG
jgi:hypothetical protein